MKTTKQILAWLLALALLAGTLPGLTVTAQAADTEEPAQTEAAETATPEATQSPALEATEAPETTEAAVPETTESTIPETIAATSPAETTAPETTEATVPETTEETLPEVTEETVPETTEETLPEETLTEEAMRTIGTDASGNTTFETFADLKELVGRSYSAFTEVHYQGEPSLEITESISIPQNLSVLMSNCQMTVPTGVTLTVNGNLNVGTLQMDGTLYLKGSINVENALNISGPFHHTGWLSMPSDAVMSGAENITYSGNYAFISKGFRVTNQTGWDAALAAAKQETNEHINYVLSIESDITLSGSSTLGGNTVLDIGNCTLRVPAGCTLELNAVNGQSHSCYSGTLLVEGTLINNTTLAFEYQHGGGKLQISSGGVYSGSGVLQIYSDESSVPQAALPGLDLSRFQATKAWEGCWQLTLKEGKIQLGTPTDLQWGLHGIPGNISWKPVEPFQGQVRVEIYQQGQSAPVTSATWRFPSTDLPDTFSVDNFLLADCESGTYYFTITSIGDGVEYYSSETAVSDTWTYVRPEAQLGVCSDLSWNWPTAQWILPKDAGGYDAIFYFAPTLGTEPISIGGNWSAAFAEATGADIFDEYIQRHGDGYYYFKVRATSSDITKCQNGPWSDLSPAYCLSAATESVNGSLDTVLQNEAAKPAEIKQAVQSLDTTDLKSAMLADQSGTGTVAKLQELEEKAGTKTLVDVTPEAAAFDQSKVSIVGAGLNDVKDEAKDIKLVVDKPAKENVIPAQYNNSVAVKFSMGLDNVQNTQALEVPVKITLPVPSKINPSFLAVLHYHADGSVEEINPYIYQSGGQYYASFVLTSFSDFAMVEKNQGIPGDLNGDGKVNTDDALHLVLHQSFPDRFELNGDGDLNSDGKVNTDDALHLVLHTSFPERFPLYPKS